MPKAPTHPPAFEFIPDKPTIPQLWDAAQSCRACDLYKNATQAVLGIGPEDAAAFFIGEQPGDQENLAGKPFVGPAGRVLAEALAQSLMGPKFRITSERGKFFETPWAPWLTATYHPSAILRMPDEIQRREARALFVADLRAVAERLRAAAKSPSLFWYP